MTFQHIFYIPTIFLIGMVFGSMINDRTQNKAIIKSGAFSNPNPISQPKTSKKILVQTFIFFLLIFIITHFFEIPYGSKSVSRILGGIEIFDKSPVFTSTAVYDRLNQFSTVGISVYKRFTYTIDILFPLSFFAFLLTFARFTSQRLKIKNNFTKLLIWLPILWLASDLLENTIIFYILTIFPTKNEILGGSLGFITVMKFGLLLLSIFAPSIIYILFKKSEHYDSN